MEQGRKLIETLINPALKGHSRICHRMLDEPILPPSDAFLNALIPTYNFAHEYSKRGFFFQNLQKAKPHRQQN